MLWHKRSVRATCLLINILANILFLFSSLRNSKNWFLYFRISEYYAFRETKGFVVFSTWSMFYMTWSDVFSDLANTCHFPQPGPSSSFIFILTLDRPLPPHHQPHATFVFSSAAAELWRFGNKRNKKSIHVHGPFLTFRKSQGRLPSPPATTLTTAPSHMAGLHSDGWRLSVSSLCNLFFESAGAWALPEGALLQLLSLLTGLVSLLSPSLSCPSLLTMVLPCFTEGLNQKRFSKSRARTGIL